MESSGTARRIIGYVLLTALLALVGWATYAHFHSNTLRALTGLDETLYIALLTKPAMAVSYNPHTKKAVLTTIKRRKLPENPTENAQDLFRLAGVQTQPPLHYYIPRTQDRDEYWEHFKDNLSLWRYDPLIIGTVAWEYIRAWHEGRTNLSPAEFLLYGLNMTQLEITDFTVRHTDEPKKKRGKTSHTSTEQDHILPLGEDRAPLTLDDRPLVIEILNASGQKGAALKLTQYLRDQSQKGLLRVDVLQYDNYPGEKQPHTRIIDYAGRLALLKQLSTAIGVNNEIISEKQDTAICDARVIIGQDFKQPL